jgi:hypothetical protein
MLSFDQTIAFNSRIDDASFDHTLAEGMARYAAALQRLASFPQR